MGRTVLAGRRTDKLQLALKKSVVGLKMTDQDGKVYVGSGTIINGCVLTNAHNVNSAMKIYSGTDLFKEGKHKLLSHAGKVINLGKGKGKDDDIAIIKPAVAFPDELSQPLDILADTIFDGVPNVSRLGVLGWGTRETVEEENAEGKVKRIDRGSGVLRYGVLTFAGFGGEETKGARLRFNRANSAQMVAPGDSGGPIVGVVDGKLKIVSMSQSARFSQFLPNDEGNLKEELISEDIVSGFGINIAKKKEAIIAAMKKLGCGVGKATGNPINEFVYKHLGKTGEKAVDTFKSSPEFSKRGLARVEQLRKLLVSHLEGRAKLQPFRTVTFDIQNRNGDIEIRWWALMALDPAENRRRIEDLISTGRSFSVPRGSVVIPARTEQIP